MGRVLCGANIYSFFNATKREELKILRVLNLNLLMAVLDIL